MKLSRSSEKRLGFALVATFCWLLGFISTYFGQNFSLQLAFLAGLFVITALAALIGFVFTCIRLFEGEWPWQ